MCIRDRDSFEHERNTVPARAARGNYLTCANALQGRPRQSGNGDGAPGARGAGLGEPSRQSDGASRTTETVL
eukprot:12390827-Alexandrium_andersonii.AAC.1